ncbi:hypothetical protein BJ878DRAFT_488490 [Calycina marina]|uniref:NDT80 domain-containing protein n=1 Tax=Calycina marina TaxID=1763456 RepID=A0A9P8CKA6_9HELO|nr:hypothetical protein BJ878DRAFT_488490 [Calycina marina]
MLQSTISTMVEAWPGNAIASYESTSMTTLHSNHLAPREILLLETTTAGHPQPHLLSLELSQLPTMDAFEHDLRFDAEVFSDDVAHGMSLPYTPSYDLSTFEDPFSSYHATPFQSLLEDTSGTKNEDQNLNTDLDNKLLGFSAPIPKAAVFDDGGQTWPTMNAELYGMFFVAEDVFGGETTGRPMELTCYRRNLFQISGTVTLSRNCTHMMNEQGQRIPIYEMSVSISALESIEGKTTDIISVPWKTSTITSSEEKSGQVPPSWPLDLNTNPELDPNILQIPIAWKRLQFKHATANNGRRKGLQQHYIIQINLMATLATGETVKVTEIQSGPVIVRGRSPRNFDSRKDVAVNERKIESKLRTSSSSEAAPPMQTVKFDSSASVSSYGFFGINTLPQPQHPLDVNECVQSAAPLLSPNTPSFNKKVALSRPPPVPKWKPEVLLKKQSHQAPIDLSLLDDDTSVRGSKGGINIESPDVAGSGRKISSPPENGDADLLYEYFPLSVDDWMPPVDAIYRPHVVHHTVVPPDLKAQQVKNKTKRYFSAGD